MYKSDAADNQLSRGDGEERRNALANYTLRIALLDGPPVLMGVHVRFDHVT